MVLLGKEDEDIEGNKLTTILFLIDFLFEEIFASFCFFLFSFLAINSVKQYFPKQYRKIKIVK
jgi:hypothetical protein